MQPMCLASPDWVSRGIQVLALPVSPWNPPSVPGPWLLHTSWISSTHSVGGKLRPVEGKWPA